MQEALQVEFVDSPLDSTARRPVDSTGPDGRFTRSAEGHRGRASVRPFLVRMGACLACLGESAFVGSSHRGGCEDHRGGARDSFAHLEGSEVHEQTGRLSEVGFGGLRAPGATLQRVARGAGASDDADELVGSPRRRAEQALPGPIGPIS